MTIAAVGYQRAGGVLLSWTDTNEDSYTITVTEVDFANPDSPSTRTVELTTPSPLTLFDEELDADTDQVTYLITNDNDAETDTVVVQLTAGWSYGEVDATETSIRYTTLLNVKAALGIATVDTTRDTRLTQAIVAAETWIDQHCGRRFPDVGATPELSSIPEEVKLAAQYAAVAFYAATGAPGEDAFTASLRRQDSFNMAMSLLAGYVVAWGVA